MGVSGMELETGGHQVTGTGQQRDVGPGLGQEEEERGEGRLQEEPRGTTHRFWAGPSSCSRVGV